MKSGKHIATLLLTTFLLLNIVSILSFADPLDEPDDSTSTSADSGSGIGLIIDDAKISNIRIGNWTLINATVVDSFDLNWEMLQTLPFPEWWMKTVWRVQFGIPDIQRYLGYTQIRLEPVVITTEGELAEGWSVKIEPNIIPETTQGKTWPIELYAKVNRLASEYNPIIKIKCTRFDVQGNYYNESYSYIPVKSVPRNFATIETTETTKRAAPNSIVSYEIEVTNEGEYKDVFQFDIHGKNDVYGLISEQALVLGSGETEYVQLTVLTPDVLFDPGTPREVEVSVYSIRNPEETYSISVNVITEGTYISPLAVFSITIILLVLLVIIVIFLLFKNYNHYLEKREFKKNKEKSKKKDNSKIFSLKIIKDKIKVNGTFEDKNKDTSKPKKIVEKEIEDEVELEVIEPAISKREIKIKQRQSKKDKELQKIARQQERQKRKFVK